MNLINDNRAPSFLPQQLPIPISPVIREQSLLTRFLARQPILDKAGRTFGYELLYRSGWENCANLSEGNIASATVIDSALTMGLDLLCDAKKAFINCTEQMLLKRLVDILPPESVVLEILESVPATAEVMDTCGALKQAGYLIALDDYLPETNRAPLLLYADIVKLEATRTEPAAAACVRCQCGPNVRLLAEKVETWTQVQAFMKAGCDLFQGYFFARPQVLEVRELRPFAATYLRIMRILSAQDFRFSDLLDGLKKEPSLCYRLLRYLNSYSFGLTGEVRSLSHALALLGEGKLRKWLTVAILAIAGANSCNELLQTALIRARFCELMASHIDQSDEDMFLTGLLSLFNVILNVSMEDMVSELALSAKVRSGLLGDATPVAKCRELSAAYCSGDWCSSTALAADLAIDEEILPPIYMSSLEWARSLSF